MVEAKTAFEAGLEERAVTESDPHLKINQSESLNRRDSTGGNKGQHLR
jgi:hypothetical protein